MSESPGPGLHIGLDTLFVTPARPGSLIDYLRNCVIHCRRVAPQVQFTLFVSAVNRVLFEDLASDRVRLARAGASNEHLVRRLLSQQIVLPRVMRQAGIDVLYASADVSPVASPCPVVLKVNTFHHEHEPWALGRARTWYRRAMIARSAKAAAAIVANSEDTRRDILRFLGVPTERVHLIYEAVDERFVAPTDPVGVRERVKQRFGLHRPYVLFLSVLYPYKNPEVALSAFADAQRRTGADVELVIAGGDYEGARARLETQAHAECIAARVRFLGPVPNADVPDLLAAALALFYPSKRETFGKPLVEAMRVGTPILASTGGAIPEITAGAALLREPDDRTGFAELLADLLTTPELRDRLRARGLTRAEAFSWPRTASALLTVLEKVSWTGMPG